MFLAEGCDIQVMTLPNMAEVAQTLSHVPTYSKKLQVFQSIDRSIYLYLSISISTCICVNVDNMHTYMSKCICMHACMHACMNACIRYMYRYIHAQTNTLTYTGATQRHGQYREP